MAPRSADERLSRMHELDLKRQTSLHQTELIHRDEEARRLKLRVIQLRDENTFLQDKICQKDSRFAENLKQSKGMRADIESAKAAARLAEAKWKKQITELNNLRAEVEALNGSTLDNAKTLQEKFALARELNRLKPELEHLQSQMSSYQAVIAEKNDLRRQVDSLEVELESEKRSKSKSRSKDDSAASSELKGKLEELEKALVLEQKEREKLRKTHDQELAEMNSQNDRVEERISALKAKLKTAQSELKRTQTMLAETQEDLRAATAAAKGAKQSTTTKGDASKKRRAQDIADGMANIGTPGYDEATSKRARKRGPEHMIAEKSTFSVTPFLNRSVNPGEESLDSVTPTERGNGRTVSFSEKPEISATPQFADDSQPDPEAEDPAEVEAEEEDEEAGSGREGTPGPKKVAGSQASTDKLQTLAKAKPKLFRETATSNKNRMASLPRKKPVKQAKPNSMPSTTDDDSEAELEGATSLETQPKPIPAAATSLGLGETDGAKRKRKLLGSAATNLFDNDDEEASKRPAKTQFGHIRKPKAAPVGAKNGFTAGSFSPLKRDRRGVGASFLA